MPLLLRKRGSSGTFWPNYDFIPCTNADELFSLDPRRYSLAGLIACQNNISLLANFGTLPTSPCCLQTLQECQCQKFHRIHFGCRYQIQNCIVCLKTLLLLFFGAVLQAKKHSDSVWFWICRTWEIWCYVLGIFGPANIQTISNLILLWTHNWYLKFCSSVSCTKEFDKMVPVVVHHGSIQENCGGEISKLICWCQ